MKLLPTLAALGQRSDSEPLTSTELLFSAADEWRLCKQLCICTHGYRDRTTCCHTLTNWILWLKQSLKFCPQISPLLHKTRAHLFNTFFFFFFLPLLCSSATRTVYRQWKHGHLLLKLTLLNINLLGRQLMVQRSESETATERAYVQLVNWSVRATRSIPPTAQRDPARAPNFDPTFIDTEATNSYIIDSKPAEAKQDRRCTRCFSFGMAAGLCELRSSTANQPHTHRRS